MKTFLHILFLLCLGTFSKAQNQSLMFEKTWNMPYNNQIVFADELNNGDYILIGTCGLWANAFMASPHQFYMGRIDKAGNIIWEKTYGDSNLSDNIGRVRKTQKGTYLLVGASELATGDVHVLNLDTDGNVIMDHIYSIGGGNADWGYSICETADSCYMITASLDVLPQWHWSPTLIKVDRQGNEMWRKRQDSLVDYLPFVIESLPDSGFIVAGQANDTYSGNSYIAKYDFNGVMEWIKYPYGANDTLRNGETGLIIHSDNTFEIIFLENLYPTDQLNTSWKIFDSDGNETSSHHYDFLVETGGYSTNTPNVNPVTHKYISTINPHAYCGQWITEIDSNYNVFFKAKLVESDSIYKYLYYSIPTSDGGYLSVGSYDRPNDSTLSQFYIVKFGFDGRYQPDDFFGSVIAYPVPSTDGNITLSFDMQTDETLDLKIFASDGRLVYSGSIFAPANSETKLPIRLDEGTTRGGIYLLEARTSDAIYRKKLVVMRKN